MIEQNTKPSVRRPLAIIFAFLILLALGCWRYSREPDSTAMSLLIVVGFVLFSSVPNQKKIWSKRTILPMAACLVVAIWVFEEVSDASNKGIKELPLGVFLSCVAFLISSLVWISLEFPVSPKVAWMLRFLWLVALISIFGLPFAQVFQSPDRGGLSASLDAIHRSSFALYFFLCLQWLISCLNITTSG